jgi:UvrB/uvrC motif
VPEPDAEEPRTAALPAPVTQDARSIPPIAGGQPGRARELSRRRTTRIPLPDTGRRHHIGSAPTELAVLGDDGSSAVTRTSPIQLADQTDAQLAKLAARIESEMRQAAGALDFERAAHLRDEAAATRAEQQGRAST